MCIGIGLISAMVGLAGTAVSVAAQMQQADTAEQIAERNAKLEESRGRYEAKQLARKLRYKQGMAIVQGGNRGIGLEGSFLDVISDNAVQGEIDIENTRRNTANRAESIRLEGQATASRYRAGAVGSIISGTGRFLRAIA